MEHEQIREDIGRLTAASEALAQSLEQLRHDLHRLDAAVTDNGQRLASVNSQLAEACKQLTALQRSVMHGNGQPALTTRVQQNSDRIKTLEGRTSAVASKIDRHADATILSRQQVIVALIGLVGAVVASCASLIVTLLRN